MTEKYFIVVCSLGDTPNLDNCISHLLAIKSTSEHFVEVLVVINGEKIDHTFPEEVIVSLEPVKGYSNVRNRAVSKIPPDTNIIFIDDDEIPSEAWLDSLIEKHQVFPNDVVFGPVFPAPGSEENSYREKFKRYFQNLPDGASVLQAATANMLIPKNLIAMNLVHFNPIFNSTGGEDTDLCFRLRNLGYRIRYAKKAVVWEFQGEQRHSNSYLDERFIREIENYSLIVKLNSSIARKTRRLFVLSLRLCITSFLFLFGMKTRVQMRAYKKGICVLFSGKRTTDSLPSIK